MAGRKDKIKEEKNVTWLSQGVIVGVDAMGQKEKRGYTLLLKGILVYMIVMGAMGALLSAFNVQYSVPVLNIVIFLCAIFCASLYHNGIWEKTGYLILLLFIIVIGNALSNYINSGFYAIANEVSERAAVFFDTSAMRSYAEQVGNRYAAVTISMCFIGGVCCVLANILISRRMGYRKAAFIALFILMIPLYLEVEPDAVYAVMLIGGLVSVYIINKGGHYGLSHSNDLYEIKDKECKISYVYAFRTIAGVTAAVFVLSIILYGVLSLFFPKSQFKNAHTVSEIKKSTMDTVENISVLGMMGLFNFYPNTGGLTSGALGGVSSVRLDLETDLTVEFAPYSDERLYLKTFTGGTYLPYSNRWSSLTDINNRPLTIKDETTTELKRRYESGMEYSARGMMRITNVAAPIGVYLPYYSEDADKQLYPGRTQEYVYYPRVYEPKAGSGIINRDESGSNRSEESGDWEYDNVINDESAHLWLHVPAENVEVIAAVAEEAGLMYESDTYTSGDVEAAVRKLNAYYQDNIPYTLRPGMTPYRKDFINYFLAENKRGYCAHFASAATLIFRYLGIPARYVEGYAVEPSDIASRGELLSDKRYEDYYDGYSPLQTDAVVSIDATDANAHAWVEVYDRERGWVVADVTPVSYEDEEGESLWQRLMNFLTGDQSSEEENNEDEDEDDEAALDEQTRQLYLRVLWAAAFIIIVILLCRPLLKKVRLLYTYYNSDRNGKLIIKYQSYIRRIIRKDKELTKLVNYEEQLRWLAHKGYWKADRKETADCVKILEKAGFSAVEIAEEEFARVMRHLK